MKQENYLPATDLSENLTTRKLMEAWYILAGDGVAVLVDTVKPRIYRVFTFGRFGTLQQLVYDTDGTEQDKGHYGIVPTYTAGEKKFYPFVHRAMDFRDNAPEKIVFEPKHNLLRMEGIQCFDDDGRVGGKLGFEIRVKGKKIIVATDFPSRADRYECSVGLYPLFTEYQGHADIQFRPVEYFEYGILGIYQPKFDRVLGKQLLLKDRQGRIPGLKISSRTGECRLMSRTDWERGNAFKLDVVVEGKSPRQVIEYEFLSNPVTVHSKPFYFAGRTERLEIAAREKPAVTVDGKPIPVRAKGAGKFEVKISLTEGKHDLLAENRSGRSKRTICAVGAPDEKLVKMGDAVCQLPWTKGPNKNIMPYFYYFDPLEAAGRGETPDNSAAYGSHSLRAFCILTPAAILTGKRKYVDRAYESLSAVIKKAHRFENGDLLLPHEIDQDGKPYLLDACRPSDLGLMVRALLYTYQGFLYFKDERKAGRCLEWAYHFAHTLTRMQQPNGSFFPRYHFPNLESLAHEPMGTVNNWAIQIWELANLYERVDRRKAAELKEVCVKHADFLLAKTPSMLRITGGGEDPPNYMDGLSSSSLFLMIKYLATGEERYKKYAEECFLMGALTTTIHVDQPQNYFKANSAWLPPYYNQPPLPNKGGMHDLTMIDAGLFLKKYLNYDFGESVAAYNFADRQVDSVMPNGAIYGMIVEAPNYSYRREDAGETLDYGCVGIYGFHYTKRKFA